MKTIRLVTAIIATLLVSVDACSNNGGQDPADKGTDVDDDASELVLVGDCPSVDDLSAAVEVPHTVVLNRRATCSPPSIPTSAIITEEGEWSEMLSWLRYCTVREGSGIPDVDMSTHDVILLGHAAFETCGIELGDLFVVRLDGREAVHFDATFIDPVGAEDCTRCAEGSGRVVVMAIEKTTETPTLCRRIRNECTI